MSFIIRVYCHLKLQNIPGWSIVLGGCTTLRGCQNSGTQIVEFVPSLCVIMCNLPQESDCSSIDDQDHLKFSRGGNHRYSQTAHVFLQVRQEQTLGDEMGAGMSRKAMLEKHRETSGTEQTNRMDPNGLDQHSFLSRSESYQTALQNAPDLPGNSDPNLNGIRHIIGRNIQKLE